MRALDSRLFLQDPRYSAVIPRAPLVEVPGLNVEAWANDVVGRVAGSPTQQLSESERHVWKGRVIKSTVVELARLEGLSGLQKATVWANAEDVFRSYAPGRDYGSDNQVGPDGKVVVCAKAADAGEAYALEAEAAALVFGHTGSVYLGHVAGFSWRLYASVNENDLGPRFRLIKP